MSLIGSIVTVGIGFFNASNLEDEASELRQQVAENLEEQRGIEENIHAAESKFDRIKNMYRELDAIKSHTDTPFDLNGDGVDDGSTKAVTILTKQRITAQQNFLKQQLETQMQAKAKLELAMQEAKEEETKAQYDLRIIEALIELHTNTAKKAQEYSKKGIERLVA